MPLSSDFVGSFWGENSDVVGITEDSLTFENNLPLYLSNYQFFRSIIFALTFSVKLNLLHNVF